MNFQITEYCHHILEEYIEEGDICIDATAGNGGDTEFLCQKVGETGNVYAFDVQEMAISHTRERLERANLSTRAKLIHDGHEKMQTYVKEEVKAITFNFGYLPGSDHKIATHPSTSLAAIESALNLLKKGGIINLCIYSGACQGRGREFESRFPLQILLSIKYPQRRDALLLVFVVSDKLL